MQCSKILIRLNVSFRIMSLGKIFISNICNVYIYPYRSIFSTRVTGLSEELQVCKRMYQCCLETEQLLKKEKQKAVEDLRAIKTANSNEIESLLKIQVLIKMICFVNKFMFNI